MLRASCAPVCATNERIQADQSGIEAVALRSMKPAEEAGFRDTETKRAMGLEPTTLSLGS
jgi:hypothetical protein